MDQPQPSGGIHECDDRVDPHKASHTAVAIGRDEDQIACVKVRATLRQVDQLLAWLDASGELKPGPSSQWVG